MQLFDRIRTEIVNATHREYGLSLDPGLLSVSPTRKEFEGDITVVIFPLVKLLRQSPQEIGKFVGAHLEQKMPDVTGFSVVQGFVNLSIAAEFWFRFVGEVVTKDNFGSWPRNGEKVMVEFSSPNTNKPLHLGHIRNILLGWSSACILEACGYEVVKVQVVNDRGIAICKSMLAWKEYGDHKTPASENIKGDHFVGDYYVRFEEELKKEYEAWQLTQEAEARYEARQEVEQSREDFFKSYKNQYFNQESGLGSKARAMLRAWEEGDPEVLALWKQMNDWVYSGFDETYRNLGVSFDRLYFESDTWKLGKKEVLDGLKRNVFFSKEDGSVWVDLEHAGMDQKILLRSDGTAVYMTQDIGTAMQRYRDYGIDRMIYVVADEQNYHFQVLFEILNMLDEPYAEGLYHLSYGMVDLPSGKMKSREGTVVDADDLVKEVISEARSVALEKGDVADLEEEDQEEIFRRIGLAALKFFILKVNPVRRMTFDPSASVDMQGQTGPYVQNAYVRIQSVQRKAGSWGDDAEAYEEMHDAEKQILVQLYMYPEFVKRAGHEYDPSLIANYCYELAKNYHRFYHEVPILNASESGARIFRLQLNQAVAQVLRHGMGLLGIEMPERM